MATTYICVLSETGFVDYTLPISSFQMRLRHSPKQCYLSVVIPGVLEHAQAISDRIDGTIALTQVTDGVETVLLDANVSAFRQYLSATDRTGEITAYKQITFSSPAQITISSPLYKSADGTVTRYRIPPRQVHPGDTITIAGDAFVPTEIYRNADPSRGVLELKNG